MSVQIFVKLPVADAKTQLFPKSVINSGNH